MKLTKAIVEVLKYHGYMTFTESTETFLKRFNTVEELGDAGFITDRGAVNFLKTIFDENGVNRSAEVSEEELNQQAVIEPEVIEPEKINPEPIVEPEPEQEKVNEPEHEKEPESTDEQGPSEEVKEPEPTPEPESAPAEKPKKTTGRKSTKKES